MSASSSLSAITLERVHQQRLADGASYQARYVYADGALLAVARMVAHRFRQ
jgi:hypothetical protein